MTQLDAKAAAFWKAYLATLPDANDAGRRFYEVFRIGNTPEGANEGAALITCGGKTATSSLLWSYEAENKPLPEIGSLSIVTDGAGNPVCVIETIAVNVRGFGAIDAGFAHDYGEWDRSLETWRARCWETSVPRCHALGRIATLEMPLVCEHFAVVYP